MAEADDLKRAHALIAAGRKDVALPLLRKLFASDDVNVRVDAGLALLVALDHLTQTQELLEVTDKTLSDAAAAGKSVHAYLLSKKAELLSNRVSGLAGERRNLNLAALALDWIDFSLEADKAEFAAVGAERARIEKEIDSLEAEVLREIDSNDNHYIRGNVFISLAEVSFHRFLTAQFDLMSGGRLKSKIRNMYWVRRLHLDRLIGYTKEQRTTLNAAAHGAISNYETAVEEFQEGHNMTDLAHAQYQLAGKYQLTFRFSKAARHLKRARRLAEEHARSLLPAIDELGKKIRDKYRHPRNWIQELGMDLPRGLRR
jgi:hypothetical protein